MKMQIALPYAGAERYTGMWAGEENNIDFRRQPDLALRCTMAFAALELSEHLKRFITDADIRFVKTQNADPAIFTFELCLEPGENQDGYALEPAAHGVRIIGRSRRALMYGVYELLRLSGWRWFAPGSIGECMPEPMAAPVLPKKRMDYAPAMPYGRGFDMSESFAHLLPDFLLWMVRNRMSVAVCKEPTAGLCKKLGLISKFGGHIFEDILEPDRPWDNGDILFNAHPEWYGLPEDGVRTKGKAIRVQLCVAHDDMLDYIGAELIRLLAGQWRDHNRIDIWGFDTWGSECHCDNCKRLGNNTDRSIYFLSKLRERIDAAVEKGELDHQVELIMCSYEGTVTIDAPTRETQENLVHANDGIVYYPINRCYEHTMAHGACPINARYQQIIKDWEASPNRLPLVIGEYYNVSKFEDLPLMFRRTIGADIAGYVRDGFTGATYMHAPMILWGVRALTQYTYASLTWNPQLDMAALEDEYFTLLYGEHEVDARAMYDLLDKGLCDIAVWRAWDGRSILSQLLRWNGQTPEKPLGTNSHLPEGLEAASERSLTALSKAHELALAMVRRERAAQSQTVLSVSGAAVNPAELQRFNAGSDLQIRLEEAERQTHYAYDLMSGLTAAALYYTALYDQKPEAAEKHWARLEQAEECLGSYYAPITCYKRGGPRVEDALTRAQLRGIIWRCRIARN